MRPTRYSRDPVLFVFLEYVGGSNPQAVSQVLGLILGERETVIVPYWRHSLTQFHLTTLL